MDLDPVPTSSGDAEVSRVRGKADAQKHYVPIKAKIL